MKKELKNPKTAGVKREFTDNNKTLENVLIEILKTKIKNQPYVGM